jgi:hypothetical protein
MHSVRSWMAACTAGLASAAHQLLDLAARQALERTCPMVGCEGAGGPGRLLEARWSVSTVCDATLEPLAFGALQQAGRQHGPDRRPHPKSCACVVIERCAATAEATGDAELAAARGCETR